MINAEQYVHEVLSTSDTTPSHKATSAGEPVLESVNYKLALAKGICCLPLRGLCKKRCGKKEPPLWTVVQGLLLGGRSQAELPGVGKQGSEGVSAKQRESVG